MQRRSFLTSVGLASLPMLAAGKLVLGTGVTPTEGSGELGAYGDYMRNNGLVAVAPPQVIVPATKPLVVTEDNIEGPYFRPGAPTRFAITQPYEPGIAMVISGRVWGFDTKKPLANAVLHIWQADEKGHYDNEDQNNPPAKDAFTNRGIIFTDSQGRYAYQTIHPGAYEIGPKQWRPAHIHYMVIATGYESLTTQLYFDGDPHNKVDRFIKQSLIIKLQKSTRYKQVVETGVFDIVLKQK